MSRGSLRRTASAVIASVVAVSGLALAQPAGAAEPVRILFTGDSITHGFEGDYTYRLRVSEDLERQGVPFDLVGSRHAPYTSPGGPPAHYLQPFDSDHFALGATKLVAQKDLIGPEVATQRPDVVVSMLGLNDLRFEATPAAVEGYLRAWVANLRAAKPDTAIVLMQVLPRTNQGLPWLTRGIPAFNRSMAQVAAELTTTESRIVVARSAAGWDQDAYSYDGVHANPTGETFLAQRVGEALRTLGVLPGAPRAPRALPWKRELKAVVGLNGRRATITWNRRAVHGVRLWIRRGGEKGRLLPTTYRTAHVTTSELVAGAPYEFRLVAVRGTMSSTLGPGTFVTVPRSTKPPAAAPKPPGASVKAPTRVSRVVVTGRSVRWTRSSRATSYVVKVRRAGSSTWHTKRTRSQKISVRGIARAKVYAVNAKGRSAARTGVRPTS